MESEHALALPARSFHTRGDSESTKMQGEPMPKPQSSHMKETGKGSRKNQEVFLEEAIPEAGESRDQQRGQEGSRMGNTVG